MKKKIITALILVITILSISTGVFADTYVGYCHFTNEDGHIISVYCTGFVSSEDGSYDCWKNQDCGVTIHRCFTSYECSTCGLVNNAYCEHSCYYTHSDCIPYYDSVCTY